MKKRLISLLLVFTMVLSLLPVSAMAAQTSESTTTVSTAGTTNPFVDVKETDWFYDAVQYARANGFFSGTSATTFNPEGTMTRGMFVTVLGHMAGVDAELYKGASAFEDVPEDVWYAPFVTWAAKHGITAGTGEGKFSPDAFINREQMATLFVNYFKAFNVEYKTDANITTTPADVDSISGWAKEAALKLWSMGLMVGNGVSFNPQGSASRAQAASLCKSADQAVAVWYKAPGEASDRVSIDPNAVKPVEPEKPEEPKEPGTPDTPTTPVVRPSRPSGSNSGYQVTFALGNNISAAGVDMPQSARYPKDTLISTLPTPFKENTIFVGWFYDKAMTQAVEANATLSKSTTLYAKMAEAEPVAVQELATFATITVEANRVSSFDFTLKATAGDANVADAIESFVLVSAGNAKLTTDSADPDYKYTVSGTGVVKAPFKQGQNYLVKLKEDAKVEFVVDGVAQGESIRTLSIITDKEEVQNLTLNTGIKYLPFTSVGNMTGTALDGLFNVGTTARSGAEQNKNEGTFTYAGAVDFYGNDIQLGDTVAIYEGTVPDQRNAVNMTRADAIGNEGAVAYVEVYKYDKDTNTYYYRTAETEDVLFTPDVLPFAVAADQDTVDNQITVDTDLMDFSDSVYQQMGLNLNADTVAEPGDYIVLFTQWGTGEVTYGRIASVTEDGENTIIAYTDADETEVLASMDIYASRNEELEMTDEEKEKIESDIKNQALESGFLDEAAEYLTALAIETNGFQEISEDLDMDLSSYSITFDDGTPVDPESMELMAGLKASIDDKSVDVNVMAGDLTHFKDGEVPLSGLRAELVLSFSVSFKSGDKEKMRIEMQAIFEQELLLSINVSGGAVWKWAWIIPYLYDYNMNANLDVGTYTGIGITATIKTVGEEDEEEEEGDDKKDENKNPTDEFDWKEVVDVTSKKLNEIDENIGKVKGAYDRIVNIGDEIKELMESKQELFRMPNKAIIGDGESAGTVEFKSLEERYAEMMEEAEESWIKIFEVKIFESAGFVDPFHILVYGINADFVVNANLYITMGMTFEYEVAKRYNFSLMLFHGKVTNETIDLVPEHYQFDFYVMGTAGIRAGIEFEIEMGLFSLELDSIGISAELGAYAQLWGYFYYHLSWNEEEGKQSTCSGALAIEIGAYLSVKFKAQMLNMEKLTYNPTLFEDEFPILTVGSVENVRDFNYGDDDDLLAVEMKAVKSMELPTELFEMAYMDMKTGELHGGEDDDEPINYDDDKESRFIIELSNPKFKYDPKDNILSIDVDEENDSYEECEMTITWGGAPLAFTSDSISRTVKIEWKNPAGMRTITFLSYGGSTVDPIVIGYDEVIRKGPDGHYKGDPTREGYDFVGWFLYGNQEPFEVPDIMPNYELHPRWGRGVVVYAEWRARNDTPFEVRHNVEDKNGNVVYTESTWHVGTTMQPSITDVEKVARWTNDCSSDNYYISFYEEDDIKGDGSTVVDVYYRRKTFYITVDYNKDVLSGIPVASTEPLKIAGKYGSEVIIPILSFEGMKFNGYTELYGAPALTFVSQADGTGYYVAKVLGEATYRARWEANANIPYRVEHWMRKPAPSFGYTLAENGVEYKFGETKQRLYPGDHVWTGDKLEQGFKVGEKDPYRVEAYGMNTYDDTNQWRVAADGSTVIKIYYERETYTVQYSCPNGMATSEVEYGSLIPLPTVNYQLLNTKVPGKTFLGWYTADGNGQLGWGNKVEVGVDLLTDLSTADPYRKTITLYARYYVPEYKITYELKGGQLPEGVTNPGTYNVDSGTITLKAPVKEGYTFLGWSGSTGTDYAEPNVTINPQKNPDSLKDLNYIANWEINKYKFVQNPNNGDDPIESMVEYNAPLSASEPSREGYTFAGWEPALPESMPAHDVTIVAKWTANGHTISFDSNGGSAVASIGVAFGTAIPELPVPNRAGYAFAGWTGWDGGVQPGTMPNKSVTLTAQWTPKNYTITFDSNGGSAVASITAAYDSAITPPADPTREGYTFNGWNPVLPATMPLNGVSTTAVWQINSYTLTLAPGYEGAEKIERTLQYGAEIKNLPTLSDRTGYTFGGWENVPATMPSVDTTVYAKWVPVSYQINYSNTYGSMDGYPLQHVYGTATVIPDAIRPGYAFAGWMVNGSGLYTNLTLGAEDYSADITLTANWIANTDTAYAVHHYLEKVDGSGYESTPVLTENLTGISDGETKASARTYEGFTARPIAQKTIAADGSTIVAVYYTRNRYTLTFDAGGGEGGMTASLYYGAAIDVPTVTRNGYAFSGWNSEIAKTMPAKSVTYVAQWTANTYSVVFEKNAPQGIAIDGTMSRQSFVYGTAQNLFANAYTLPANSGYTFLGWAKSADAVTADYTNGQSVINLTAVDKGSITLYAVWQMGDAVTYTVNHYKMGLDGQYGAPITDVKTGVIGTLTAAAANNYEGFTLVTTNIEQQVIGDAPIVFDIYYSRNRHTLTFELGNGEDDVVYAGFYYGADITAPSGLTKTGYTFTGWNTTVAQKMPDNDLTYTAKWTINRYTITFNTGGGSIIAPITQDYGTSVAKPANPTRTGYTFLGWDQAIPETLVADVTITAQWKVNQYTITFDTDGGTEIAPITQDYGTQIVAPANPTKTGYTFEGWDVGIPATMGAENLTITAKWSIKKCTITFNTVGGTEIAPITQNYGTAITKPADPTRTGYTFLGWDQEIPGIMSADMTITAKWSINQYTITFNTGGGTVIAPITQDYGTNITKPSDPTRTGYTFVRWDQAIPATMGAANVTIQAIWNANTYTVEFNANGGTCSTTDKSVTYDSSYGELPTPTCTGHSFLGWFTKAEGGDKVTASDIVAITSGQTLYAQWSINQYTITFDTDGGSAIAPITQAYGTAIVAPANPTRYGYTFNGWDQAIPTSMPDGDMTITALWKIGKYTITYDLAGGTEPSPSNPKSYDVTALPVSLVAPTKTGYHFIGWTGSNGNIPQTEVVITELGNFNYTANWEANTYTLQFVSTADGKHQTLATISIAYGEKLVLPLAEIEQSAYAAELPYYFDKDGSGSSVWYTSETKQDDFTRVYFDKAFTSNEADGSIVKIYSPGVVSAITTYDKLKWALEHPTEGIPNRIILGANIPAGGNLAVTSDTIITGPVDANGDPLYTLSTGLTLFRDYSLTLKNVKVSGVTNGIYLSTWANQGASLTIENCIFTGNDTTVDSDTCGVLYIEKGTVVIKDSSFIGNTGWPGGAIYATGGTITIEDCTFENNSSGVGGAVFMTNSCVMTVTNCTFTDNVAENVGGAIYNDSSTATLTVDGCTFTGNTGNGAIASAAPITLNNCTFGDDQTVIVPQ